MMIMSNMLRYNHTSYTKRTLKDVISDIDRYYEFYPNTNGIFFDEMSNESGKEGYYVEIAKYARTENFQFIIGNRGTDLPSSFVDVGDVFVVYENVNLPDLSRSFQVSSDKSKLAIIAYEISDFPKNWTQEACQKVSWLFL